MRFTLKLEVSQESSPHYNRNLLIHFLISFDANFTLMRDQIPLSNPHNNQGVVEMKMK